MFSAPRLTAIPYRPDSAGLFAAVRHLPSAVWLDSGRPGSPYGRYDIISAAPEVLLTSRGPLTEIRCADGRIEESSANPFDLLRDHLPTHLAPLPQVPFCGGALGYFGYDLGRHLERLPERAARDIALPDGCVGIYSWALVQDHEQQQAWLVGPPEGPHNQLEYQLKSILEYSENNFNISEIKPKVNANKYAKDLDIIQRYIRAGDCYQVNYAQRFSASYRGDPFAAYLALRRALPSPFSGYMDLGPSAEGHLNAVLSLSPERFVRVRDGRAETNPIKGTSVRAANPTEDLRNAQRLQHSVKDRAENLMIVDLLRNDLSKTCTQVAVPELFALQSFANVHHLVSTVTGNLKPGTSALEVLRGCFPGGSITGAPKIRAMEIIEELEPTRRSVYCGSLGYLSADGAMDTSIAIRTLVCDNGNIHCWGGGGIVADSVVEQEYQESINKVKLLLDTLQQQFGDSDPD